MWERAVAGEVREETGDPQATRGILASILQAMEVTYIKPQISVFSQKIFWNIALKCLGNIGLFLILPEMLYGVLSFNYHIKDF